MKAILNLILILSSAFLSFKQADSQSVYNKIVFSRQESQDDWDLWLMDLEGNNQTRILNSPYNDSDPHFRSDGAKILFTRLINGIPPVQDIFLVNPDGTGLVNLTLDITEEVSRPKWSWTGNQVVFCKTVGINDKDIYTMNADGSNKRAMVTGINNDEWPAFSPDGQKITFQRYIGSASNQKSKICLYNISQGTTTDLTDGSNLDEMPTFSPDGKYLLFKRGTTTPDIYRLKIGDGTVENLTYNSDFDEAPTYSYDGTKIAWMQSISGISSAEIWTMNIDGSEKKQLTSNSVADFNPSFSPTSQAGFSTTAYPERLFNIFQYGQDGLVCNYQCITSKTLTLEIYDVMGNMVVGRDVETYAGENQFFIRQIPLKKGIYVGILFDHRGCLGGSKFIFRN